MENLNMRKFLAAFAFAAFTAGLAVAPVSFDVSSGLKTGAAFAQEKEMKKEAQKPKKDKAKKDKPKKDKPKKDKPKKDKKKADGKAEAPAKQ